jgi:DNA-binding LytR/AlgR family response regulator
LILEDNEKTLLLLKKIVEDVNESLKVYTLTNLYDAYKCMLEHNIDLFLVDIILTNEIPNDASGLYFAEKIRMIDKYLFTPLVFITSLEDSKFITYEKLHCYSFIEKPFDPLRVKEVVNQCLRFPQQSVFDKVLYFKRDGIIFSINQEEIVYVESIKHVLYIYTKNNDILKIPYVTLKNFMEMVDNHIIYQCRRNLVFNLNHVINVDFTNGIIQFSNGSRIEMGITYKNEMRKLFTNESTDFFD